MELDDLGRFCNCLMLHSIIAVTPTSRDGLLPSTSSVPIDNDRLYSECHSSEQIGIRLGVNSLQDHGGSIRWRVRCGGVVLRKRTQRARLCWASANTTLAARTHSLPGVSPCAFSARNAHPCEDPRPSKHTKYINISLL